MILITNNPSELKQNKLNKVKPTCIYRYIHVQVDLERKSPYVCIHVLDGKDPTEGDGGQCTSDDGAGGVTNGKEDEEDGLLPVVFVEGAGVG